MAKPRVSAAEFVRVYSAVGPKGASEQLGMPLPYVKIKAANLVKRGVSLPTFPAQGGNKLDIAALNAIAAEVASEESEG